VVFNTWNGSDYTDLEFAAHIPYEETLEKLSCVQILGLMWTENVAADEEVRILEAGIVEPEGEKKNFFAVD
jgi:hypothetical protein